MDSFAYLSTKFKRTFTVIVSQTGDWSLIYKFHSVAMVRRDDIINNKNYDASTYLLHGERQGYATERNERERVDELIM